MIDHVAQTELVIRLVLDRDSPGFQRPCILSPPSAIEPSNHQLLASDSCRSARNPQINNATPGTSARKASPLNMPAKYVFSAAEIPVSKSGNIKAAPPAAARIPLKQPHGKHRSRLPPRASQASVLLSNINSYHQPWSHSAGAVHHLPFGTETEPAFRIVPAAGISLFLYRLPQSRVL